MRVKIHILTGTSCVGKSRVLRKIRENLIIGSDDPRLKVVSSPTSRLISRFVEEFKISVNDIITRQLYLVNNSITYFFNKILEFIENSKKTGHNDKKIIIFDRSPFDYYWYISVYLERVSPAISKKYFSILENNIKNDLIDRMNWNFTNIAVSNDVKFDVDVMVLAPHTGEIPDQVLRKWFDCFTKYEHRRRFLKEMGIDIYSEKFLPMINQLHEKIENRVLDISEQISYSVKQNLSRKGLENYFTFNIKSYNDYSYYFDKWQNEFFEKILSEV